MLRSLRHRTAQILETSGRQQTARLCKAPLVTTLAELEEQLPWGFHDAYLEGLTIDWLGQTLTLVMRFPMTKNQDVERRAQVIVSGLFFCSIEPPSLGDSDYKFIPNEGLWIDGKEGPSERATGLPSIPASVFLHHIWVRSWNFRTIHIAGRDARLVWLGDEAPRKGPGGALFPGDEIPEP